MDDSDRRIAILRLALTEVQRIAATVPLIEGIAVSTTAARAVADLETACALYVAASQHFRASTLLERSREENKKAATPATSDPMPSPAKEAPLAPPPAQEVSKSEAPEPPKREPPRELVMPVDRPLEFKNGPYAGRMYSSLVGEEFQVLTEFYAKRIRALEAKDIEKEKRSHFALIMGNIQEWARYRGCAIVPVPVEPS